MYKSTMYKLSFNTISLSFVSSSIVLESFFIPDIVDLHHSLAMRSDWLSLLYIVMVFKFLFYLELLSFTMPDVNIGVFTVPTKRFKFSDRNIELFKETFFRDCAGTMKIKTCTEIIELVKFVLFKSLLF